MKCVCEGCRNDAVAWCQWGSDSIATQQADFCKVHLDELWGMLNPLLQLNKAWFRIDRPQQGEVPMSEEIHKIGDDLANMTLAEVAQLRDYLKETHGLDPSPKIQMESPPKQEEIAPVKTEYSVVLEGVTDDTKKITVTKTVKEILGLSLIDASNFVKAAPKEVKSGIPESEAKDIASRLEAAGAKVTVK